VTSQPAYRQAIVIGTGQMGPGIAATIALGGVPATIVGRTLDSCRHGLRMARKALLVLEENEIFPVARINWALENIADSADLEESARAADLVVESGPEDMAFKQDLFCRLDEWTPPETTLATNTSGLSITAIASTAKRDPGRIVTTHFWNPPHLMPLVEIVRGERTREDVALKIRDFLRSAGKVPVLVKKDRPGQLGNRLQAALQREAMYIVQEGIADPADVDLAARTGFGLRMPAYGIFEHIDNAGLDLVYSVVDYVSRDLYNQPAAPPIIIEKVGRGETGAQNGKGFYEWEVRDVRAMRERRDAFLVDFLKRYTPGG
jgi:3-hydroxybutyryl-CoA dehydrogenase